MANRTRLNQSFYLAGIAACFFSSYSASAEPLSPEPWTLQRSIERGIAIAPELKSAQAGIRAGEGELERAGEWPNPSVSLRVDNNIRQQQLRNGYTVDQMTVSQPIPLWRLKHQQKVAEQGILAARADVIQTRLNIETRVARLFLSLQLDHEKLTLAEQRLKFTHKRISSLRKPTDASGIGRYVAPLDRSRLQLLHAAADLDTAEARNNYQESLEMFRTYLALPSDAPVTLTDMRPAATPAALPQLEKQIDSNTVLLRRLHHRVLQAEAGVNLEHARRFDDPVLTFIREKNVNVNNQTFSFNGVLLSVSLPLWDRNNGNIERARAEVMRAESQFDVAKRELMGSLRQSHIQLQHMLTQAGHFKQAVLQPARSLLQATERNYDIGASTSLAMIDAYNTYFTARNRYLDILFRSHQKSIDLNQMLGRSLIATGDTGVQS